MQAKLKTQEASNGQFKFSTLQMGMPVPYYIYPKVSSEEIVRNGKRRRERYNQDAVLCSYKKVEIIAGAVCADHVHLCVSIPPKLSISDFVGYLKGKSALMIFDKHPELGSKWDRSFWARGYYVATVGNVNEETVKEYIRRQTEESMNEEKKSYRPL